MATFKISVSWESYGVINVEAKTIKEAIEIANNDDSIDLPPGDYVDASWKIDNEISKEMNS